jgi:tetratricopeptide (TPR) repeat protein
LKVDFVISGSVRRDSERVRVTVQLVSTQAEAALWADKFDEGFTDIFGVEDSISERVTAALSLRLSGDERRSLTRRHTENPEAHQLYLRGRYFWNKRSLDTVQKAAECFRQAIELDADYALAYAGLADSYIILGVQAGVVGGWAPNEAYPVARQAAVRALELDETLSEAHASLGYISFYYDWSSPAAENEYRRALELSPNYATTHHWYAMSLMCLGQPDQALARIEKAQELDPLSLIINANGGSILYHARRYDEAVAALREVIKMETDFVPARYRLGVAYVALEMYPEAAAEFREVEKLSAGSPLALAALGYTCARSGRRNEAQKILGRLTEMSKRRYVPPANVAEVYAGLGEHEQALDWLERACDERDHALVRLVVNPWWDNLRSEPRFQKLLRRVGLWP